MKIAFFHNLPSGGAKRAVYGYVKYLTKAGHTVDVFIPSTAEENFLGLREFVKEIKVLPVKSTLIGSIKSIWYGYRFSLADLEVVQKRLAAMINRGDYDVVFVEQDRYTLSPFILKFLEKPNVYYCQQPSRENEGILIRLLEQSGEYKGLRGWLRRSRHWFRRQKIPSIDAINASFAKYILTNSYFSREAILRAYGLNSFVCYLGVDIETFHPLQVSREDYVLSVGSLGPSKGYEFIVRALGHIDEKIRPAFVIVANSVNKNWQQYIMRLSVQMGVKIEIRTLISDAELAQLYNKAKLLVYAPYLEPFGLVPLEAMACGTPVVAVKEGGVRESVLNNETGVLTERDESLFAEVITALLLDDKRRERMGRNAVEVVREFWTLEHARDRLLWHLERAIHLQHARPAGCGQPAA